MPGYTPPPVTAEDISEEVWEYVNRVLTNPAAAQDLANMLPGISPTAAGRAALLDLITAARLGELDPANIPGNIDTLLTRLTAGRAALLDNLIGLDATISSRASALALAAIPTTPELEASAATRYGSLFLMDRGRVKIVDVGDIADWHIEFFDIGGAVIPAADITAGSCTIEQWRGVVHVDDKTPTSHVAADGEIHTVYTFSVAEGWLPGDTAHVIVTGGEVEVGGVTTYIPNIEFHVHISRDLAIQAYLENGTYGLEALKNAIDQIEKLQEHSVDTLTADGSEQPVAELVALGTLEGHIDLSNMGASDSVTIREKIKLKVGGTYRLYDSKEYSGVQTKPAIHVVKLPTKYGAIVTLEQTAKDGGYKTFDYNFFEEVLA